VEVVEDMDVKKENWFEPMAGMWSGPEDPNFYLLRFNTERYSMFFADEMEAPEAVGVLAK